MQVLVTGATGFIGSHFVPFLAQRGHTVQRVTRRPSRTGDVAWDPTRGAIDAAALQLPDAVWNVNTDDWFLAEQFQLVQYSLADKHFKAVGALQKYDDKTEEITPDALING